MRIKLLQRSLLGLLVVVLVSAGIALVLTERHKPIDEHSARRLWNDYRQNLLSAGEPLTMAAVLARRPELPPDRNGATVLEGLADDIVSLCDEPVNRVPLFDRKVGRLERVLADGLPRSSIEPMRAFLQAQESLISKVGRVSSYDDGRLSTRWYVFRTNPLEDTFDAGKVWVNAAKTQELLALSHLVDGTPDKAVDAAAVDFAIANTLRHEPIDMALMIRASIVRQAVLLLEAALAAGEVDAEQLQRQAVLIERALETLEFDDWIRYNRALVIRAFDQVAAGTLTTLDLYSEANSNAVGTISIGEARLCQHRAAEAWSELLDVADRPGDLLASAKRLADEYSPTAALAAGVQGATGKIPHAKSAQRQKVAYALDPFVSSTPLFVASMIEHLALLRCARVALEAEAFRVRHGRLPNSLDELANRLDKNLLVDPFAGKPLELIRTKTGIAIYSVGRDEEDNHGDIEFSTRAYRSPDVGLRLADMQHRHALPIDENR